MDRKNQYISTILRQRPDAVAILRGSDKYPRLRGEVRFYQTRYGVIVAAEVTGLPMPTGNCQSPVFGFHLHSGGSCTGTASDPFADAKGHYNPQDCPHPHHAGDMPPLFGSNGYAFSVFLTDRFSVDEVIGRVVIIHAKPDDFTTQPSGNAGEMIACGSVRTDRQFAHIVGTGMG